MDAYAAHNPRGVLLAVLATVIVVVVGIVALVMVHPRQDQEPVASDCFVVTSPAPQQSVSFPLTITGTVNWGCWNIFEANAGSVYVRKNGEAISDRVGLPTTGQGSYYEESSYPRSFSTTIDALNGDYRGLAELVFEEDDACGDDPECPPDRDPVVVPITIEVPENQSTMQVQVFFGNKVLAHDPNFLECDRVFPISRTVPTTAQVGKAAVEELLQGLTQAERASGYSTAWGQGITVRSLSIANGVAHLDLSAVIGPGGSCGTAAMIAQLDATLKQFPTVHSVQVTVDGQPFEWDVLI